MGQRLIITEEEKNEIKSLYEQKFSEDDFVKTIMQDIEKERKTKEQEYIDSLSDEEFYRGVKSGKISFPRDMENKNFRRWRKVLTKRSLERISF